MRFVPAVAALLLSFPLLAAPDVATAAKNLDQARATLSSALKRVEGDAPTLADLDAAHEAVNKLKDVIDDGANQEPNDLDYARNALAARKDVREKRDFIEGRRAKLHIFNHRRTIDAAAQSLREKAKATEPKEPSSKDFEDARAAVAEVRKAIEPSRQFTKQDADFAKYLTSLDAEVAKLENAIDTKWAAVEGGKHRAKVEEARVEFDSAYKALKPTSTDEEFKRADTAAKLLGQRLDEGKVLEAKDKSYGPYAGTTRTQLVAAKKKIDELWSQTGLARLKAEIEPTANDLKNALKIVRQKTPAEDQLAEARTIAIVARKTLEKYKAEAERSEQFGQYVAGVRATLEEVEGQLQLKALAIALKDFRTSLIKIEKTPTDDDFQVANSSLLVLQKTVEPMDAKAPALKDAVGEARAWEREGKAKITKRRLEIDVATQQKKVEAARGETQKVVDRFGKADSGDDDVKAAEAAVKNIITTLNAGEALTKDDKNYAWYDKEVRKRAEEFTKKIELRKLQLFAAASKNELRAQLDELKEKIDIARGPASTEEQLTAAQKQYDGIIAFVEGKQQLAEQAVSFRQAVEKAYGEMYKRREQLTAAEEEREVRRKTIDALAPGIVAAEAAEKEKDLKKKKAGYEKALGLFKSCRDDGARVVESSAQYAKLPIVLTGLPSTVRQAATECEKRYNEVAPLIKPLTGLIFVNDGAKKAFDNGQALLAKKQRDEARAQFEVCTADAVTAGVRYPELKERTFAVGKEQLTLSELGKRCKAKAEELRKK